jgi:hypothetical protein
MELELELKLELRRLEPRYRETERDVAAIVADHQGSLAQAEGLRGKQTQVRLRSDAEQREEELNSRWEARKAALERVPLSGSCRSWRAVRVEQAGGWAGRRAARAAEVCTVGARSVLSFWRATDSNLLVKSLSFPSQKNV